MQFLALTKQMFDAKFPTYGYYLLIAKISREGLNS